MAMDVFEDSGSDLDSVPVKITRLSNHNKREGSISSSILNKLKPRGEEEAYNHFTVPEILCQCQQKCTERVTAPLIQKISMYFFGMHGFKDLQKQYLSRLIIGKEKAQEQLLPKPKRIRKMSYRYFVPILTDKDLMRQTEQKNSNIEDQAGKTMDEEDWDHIEVCLKAFTAVHGISEKRVIVTRNVYKLKPNIKCTKPFPSHIPIENYTSSSLKFIEQKKTVDSNNIPSTSEFSKATAIWLMNYCQQNKCNTFAVNPKTFLPEGLILPDSIICLPIFNDQLYNGTDPGRDIDIVENFFINQLWKPEHISSSVNPRKS